MLHARAGDVENQTEESTWGALEEEAPGSRYLVVYTSTSPGTRWIAETLAAHVRGLGHVAELADVAACDLAHPADYDAAFVGVAVGLRLDRAILRWIHLARPGLDEIPTAVFVVGQRRNAARVHAHVHDIGWHPSIVMEFPFDDQKPWPARVDRLASTFVAMVDQAANLKIVNTAASTTNTAMAKAAR